MKSFKGKSILFLSVQTFQLETFIKKKLETLGASVVYFDERPRNNHFVKGIIRFKRNLYQFFIDRYYRKILEKTSHINFDFLLLLRGEVVPPFFLDVFKRDHPTCVLIFYTWDSIINNPHPVNILSYFHRTFSFDPSDSLKYRMNLRPLFYLDDFQLQNINSFLPDYDLLFLGTAHSDRYLVGEHFRDLCKKNNLRFFSFYFMHSRLVFLFKFFFDRSMKNFNYFKLSFRSLGLDQVVSLYAKSRIILDVNHINQSGLTMRTFEALGSGKKLITTNQEVFNYVFYNPNNILVINRQSIDVDINFFNTPFVKIESSLLKKLSLEGWLYEIFFDKLASFNWIK